MRGFLVLCLIGVAAAYPQGYNYPTPGFVSGASNVQPAYGGFAPGFGGGSGSLAGGMGAFINGGLVGNGGFGHVSGGFVGAPSVGTGGFVSAPFGGSGHVGGGFVGGSSVGSGHVGHVGHVGHSVGHHGHAQTIVSKHFHIFGAPEETVDDIRQEQISLGPARKHYKIVFIKAPTQSHHAAALSIQQAANEEKTIIYVLTKKADAADIKAAIQQAPQVHTKPEVFFIKYKTHEEAAHAQRTIQAQYDSLGGSTAVSDEGVAPVQSVIGALGGSAAQGAGGALNTGAPSLNYLPPHH